MKHVWEIDKWETPATAYAESQVGNFRLKKSEYPPGYYSHYCIDGYVLARVLKPIPIMLLQENKDGVWQDWMADDPMDYRSIQKYAEACYGDVLVAGLGLGLIAHELVKNAKVRSITIVEISPDVINLTEKYLPRDNRISLIYEDFWDYTLQDRRKWDWLVVDIWATVGKAQHDKVLKEEVMPRNEYLRNKYPDSKIAIHGFASVTDVPLVMPYFEMHRKGESVMNKGAIA